MKSFTINQRNLARCEYAAAIVMTVAIVILHLRVLTHAGPLWRDEIHGWQVAISPTLESFRSALVLDIFPALFYLVLRGWVALGFGTTDLHLRLLGFFIGLLITGAIWLVSRMSGRNRAPVWPLALCALNPIVIHEGDLLRGYGLAMVAVVLLLGLVWRFAFRNSSMWLAIGIAIAAVVSVQSVYINALLVFSICVGGIVATLKRANARGALLLLGAGLVAALSLLPYRSILAQAYEFTAMQKTDAPVVAIIGAGVATLSGANLVVAIIWALAALWIVMGAFVPVVIANVFDNEDEMENRFLAAFVTLTVAFVSIVGFLFLSKWLAIRYFLSLVPVAALCVHFVAPMRGKVGIRIGNLLASIAVAGIFVFVSSTQLGARQTNCDLAAAAVSRAAEPNDFVIVTSLMLGVSFNHYYQGTAPWKTVPDIADHATHRWDLATKLMSVSSPMRETLAQVDSTLKAGQRVFLVGALPPGELTPPENLPAVPPDPATWKVYEDNWRRQLAHEIEQHAVHGDVIPIDVDQPVNPLEEVGVFVVSGWRESAPVQNPSDHR